MKAPSLAASLSVLCALAATGCIGLESPYRYPDYERDAVKKVLQSPENQPDPRISLQTFKFRDELCEGVDTSTATKVLSSDDLSRFLQAQGMQQGEIKARGNLFWFEMPGSDSEDEYGTIRLRVAVLDDSKEAANELHKSLLEHGPGWWGLRRANLSVLAPKASVAEAVAFVVRYKLACWGMFEMADADDAYVVPGPYMEL